LNSSFNQYAVNYTAMKINKVSSLQPWSA